MQIGAVDNQINKPGTGAVLGSALLGAMVANGGSKLTTSLLASPFLAKMLKISNSLTEDEFKAVAKATSATLTQTGLDKKGFSIIRATEENLGKIANIIIDEANGNLFTRFLPHKMKEAGAIQTTNMVKQGLNAFCAFKNKKIIMPEKNLALSFFHEAGHAMNASMSTLGKALQKCRPLMLLTFPIMLIGLLKNPKAEGEQPKGFWDKTTTFIKNHAGKLAFMTFVPTIIEEGMASVKGNKLAKQFLSADLAKKVATTNKLGFATYVIGAALAGVGMYLGIKLRDCLLMPKQEKVQNV